MKRKILICLLVFVLIQKVANQSSAQELLRVAIFSSHPLSPYLEAMAGLKSSLPAHYLEYDMKGDEERGEQIVKQIKKLQPDAVVAIGSEAAAIACKQIKNIPVVFTMVLNPRFCGLSCYPGVSLDISAARQFKILKEVLPGVKRVGVIYYPAISKELINEAKRQGLSLVSQAVESEQDIPQALKALLPRIDLFWLIVDPYVANKHSSDYILKEALLNRVPVMSPSPVFVKNGALLSISPDYKKVGHQTANLVRKVIKGDRCGIETVEDSILSLNLNTAKLLRIDVSDYALKRASQIIDGGKE